MEILRMVLVINSPQVIWTYLCWMTTLLSKTNGRKNAMIIWQTMKKGLQICSSAFECVSKYTLFIEYTLLCMLLKTMILPVWMPINSLIWWYSFIKIFLNMPMDAHPLKYSAIPIRNIHMNSSFHKNIRKTYTRTGIAFQGHNAQNQFQIASIRSIPEEIERNKSTLTLNFHRTPSQRQSTKVCTTYIVNIPMLVSFIHGISYWHLCGCARDTES